MIININDQSTTPPNQIDGTYPPTMEQLWANGWRNMPEVPPVQSGYTRVSCVAVDGDGKVGYWVIDDQPTAALEYTAREAKLATLNKEHLYAYRALLRAYFGNNAETNRNITAAVVESYFLTTPGLSVEDVQHGMTLKGLFEELSAWNGTGETWTLPYEVLP